MNERNANYCQCRIEDFDVDKSKVGMKLYGNGEWRYSICPRTSFNGRAALNQRNDESRKANAYLAPSRGGARRQRTTV